MELMPRRRNLGIDQLSLGEDGKLTASEISLRKDIEWYRLFVVPGKPETGKRTSHRPPDTIESPVCREQFAIQVWPVMQANCFGLPAAAAL